MRVEGRPEVCAAAAARKESSARICAMERRERDTGFSLDYTSVASRVRGVCAPRVHPAFFD